MSNSVIKLWPVGKICAPYDCRVGTRIERSDDGRFRIIRRGDAGGLDVYDLIDRDGASKLRYSPIVIGGDRPAGGLLARRACDPEGATVGPSAGEGGLQAPRRQTPPDRPRASA